MRKQPTLPSPRPTLPDHSLPCLSGPRETHKQRDKTRVVFVYLGTSRSSLQFLIRSWNYIIHNQGLAALGQHRVCREGGTRWCLLIQWTGPQHFLGCVTVHPVPSSHPLLSEKSRGSVEGQLCCWPGGATPLRAPPIDWLIAEWRPCVPRCGPAHRGLPGATVGGCRPLLV